MIYTVTLNPSLDYLVTVENFQIGQTNRAFSEQIVAGGKGLNISMVLQNLGISSTAFGFTAGFTGVEIEKQMKKNGIQTDFIHLKNGFSRINFKLLSMEGTEVNGCGPMVSPEEMNTLKDKIADLKSGDILILSGSIPASVPSRIYRELGECISGREIRLIADTSGKALLELLPLHPFLIKPNHQELGELFRTEITSRRDAVPYAARLQALGARNVLVSLAGQGAILLDETGTLWEAPALAGTLVNGVGAGDSMIAGFLAGWEMSEDYPTSFRMALAAGSATAFSHSLAEKSEIMKLFHSAEIFRISDPVF